MFSNPLKMDQKKEYKQGYKYAMKTMSYRCPFVHQSSVVLSTFVLHMTACENPNDLISNNFTNQYT